MKNLKMATLEGQSGAQLYPMRLHPTWLGFTPSTNISRPDYYCFYQTAEQPGAPGQSSPAVATMSPGKPLPTGLAQVEEADPRAQVGSFSWALSPHTSQNRSWSHGLLGTQRGPLPGRRCSQ